MAEHTHNAQIDNARFILIISVVSGHILEPHISNSLVLMVWQFFRIFTMPGFAFLAGCTVRANPKDCISRDFKQLIIPFIYFSISYESYYFISQKHLSHYIKEFAPYWILWFLPCLFIWRAIYHLVPKQKYLISLAILASLAAGLFSKIGYPLSLSRLLYFFPFFVAGSMVHTSETPLWSFISNKNIKLISIIFFCALLYYINQAPMPKLLLFGSSSYHAMGVSNLAGIIYRLQLYTISALSIFFFMSLVPKQDGKISSFGRNSLYINLLHGFIVASIINPIMIKWLPLNGVQIILVATFCGVLITYILGGHVIKIGINAITNIFASMPMKFMPIHQQFAEGTDCLEPDPKPLAPNHQTDDPQ